MAEKDGAELKTCPMCDGKAYANTVNRDRWQGRSGVYVSCQRKSCSVHGRVYATRAKAIAAWNTRASDALLTERDAELAAQTALVERLRTALEKMCSDVNRSDYHARRTAFEQARAALVATRAQEPQKESAS